jgi:RHS repeat-associated protein
VGIGPAPRSSVFSLSDERRARGELDRSSSAPLIHSSFEKERIMGFHRLSFTERRRRRLAKKANLDRLETRNTITEPISITGLLIPAISGLVRLGIMHPNGGSNARSGMMRPTGVARQSGSAGGNPIVIHRDLLKPIPELQPQRAAGAGGGSIGVPATSAEFTKAASAESSNDWLTLNTAPAASASDPHGISAPWHPAKGAGGGAAQAPRGGSSASGPASASTRGAITALTLPPSTAAASSAGGASAALLAAAAGASGTGTATASAGSGVAAAASRPVHASQSRYAGQATPPGKGTGGIAVTPDGDPGASSSGGALPGSTPDPVTGNGSGASQSSFAFFPMYVLDNNSGVVLYPGVQQLATLSAKVDLRAQVSGATVSTYNWDTSGLTDANTISGTSTYELKFTWTTENPGAPHSDAVTLSVTDTNSHSETYTYDFWVGDNTGGSSSGGTGVTWPTSLAPNQELLSAPAFDSNNSSVDALSGSLDTDINLPSYNPNVPALALTYDSVAANPQPMIIVENTLSSSAAVPTKVSGQLTFNGGTPLTAYYYDTSKFNPGDVQQIALEATNATALATNRYSYSAQVVDIGTTNTTSTYSGTATELNYSGNAFGAGWTLKGLEQITSETGGVILDLGDSGRTLWFASSGSGGSYTTPAGEFSTLSKSGSTYTRAMPDGTQITFNSGGYETAVIDRNNQHITFAYNGSNQLSTITDNYSNITTFSYSGGYLQTIKDPAGRIATFTHSSANLTGVTLPDSSTWGYAYASGGQLTQITDARSHTSTIAYDSAGRVGTISRPDSTSETFTNHQESGWTNSGTSGSPAAATLLAQAGGTYTSPNGNLTTIQPDWNGFGLGGNVIDPIGNVQLYDRDSNGLATVAVDQVNRNTQYKYDSKGNVTQIIFEDDNTQQYTYNSDSEPVTFTNENSKTTNFTYDGNGNLTVIQDALSNLTSMSYTGTGRLNTVKDANSKTTTYLYDSQDRLTTIQFPDSSTNVFTYNSQGNVTKVVDGRNNAMTFSFDALNRETGSTDALNDVTTLTYDSGGNLTQDQEPTPASQTARTTKYAYDSINRLTTLTDPLSHANVFGYDSDGNRVKVTDAMSRVTTVQFDALDRPTVVIDPMSGYTTTTYDGDSEVTQVSDPLGRVTTTAYDNRGWVATVTDPLGNTTTYAYTATGKESSATNPGSGGGSEAYHYDNNDRLIANTDPNSNSTTIGYDGVGNRVTVTDANGHTVTYAYDFINRVTTITDALSDSTVIGYDSGGNQISVKDALGHIAATQYDALDRATTMTSAISGTTTITYDAAGRETSLTDPVGNKTQWAYDANDRVTTMTLPNSATVTYVYDNDNELTDTTDADGRRTTYSYDSGGDQTGETWVGASPSEKITYTYDADNELTGANDGFATLTLTYDSGGNEITAATSGPGTGQPSVTLTSGYNAQHSLTSVTDNITGNVGRTTYVYDAGQRLTTITTSYNGTAGPQVITSYAPNNQISTQSRTIGASGTAVNTTYQYDAGDRQTTITDYVSGGSALATYVYTYDQANRVSSEKDAEGTASFTYDNSNELTGVTGSRTESYAYDLNGNRTGTGYSTTVMNEIQTSPGLITYSYDNAGNTISANSGGTFTTYTYDYRNRLTGVKHAGAVSATYTYDALDRRIAVQESGSTTWTVYNGTSPDAAPYGDFNGSGTLLTRYVSGPGMVNGAVVDELLGRTSSGGTSAWYLTDRLDSVRDVVSSAGSAIDHVVYDSFGNITTQTSAGNGDRFKFAGMEYDSIIGRYFDRSRWYGCVQGRFSSLDRTGFPAGDTNLYRYVNNSPIVLVDPGGNQDPGADGGLPFPGPATMSGGTLFPSQFGSGQQPGNATPIQFGPGVPWDNPGAPLLPVSPGTNPLSEIPLPGIEGQLGTAWDLFRPVSPLPSIPLFDPTRNPIPTLPGQFQFSDGQWYYQQLPPPPNLPPGTPWPPGVAPGHLLPLPPERPNGQWLRWQPPSEDGGRWWRWAPSDPPKMPDLTIPY